MTAWGWFVALMWSLTALLYATKWSRLAVGAVAAGVVVNALGLTLELAGVW